MYPIHMRANHRKLNDLRNIKFHKHFIEHHPGSVLVCYGKTQVLIVATISNQTPQHRKEFGKGWLNAEYNMLPGSTLERKFRSGFKGQDGRSMEIQRMIGRALRQAIDLDKFGPRTITVDCDVIQADGGTRTAAITGGWLALALLLKHQKQDHLLIRQIAAISLGVKDNQIFTDLDYGEDLTIDADFSLVGCSNGDLVEFQGTAEKVPVRAEILTDILNQGFDAISRICKLQTNILN